jgi:hypothetical protein
LWIAARLARLRAYLPVFHSCNRAFHVEVARRLDSWCGECDKCCFVDLVLAPFLGAAELSSIFAGREPLSNAALEERFATLLGATGELKPFECVGDVEECRAALVLASERADRAANPMVRRLLDRLGHDVVASARRGLPALLGPHGCHHIPDALVPPASLV